MGSAERSVAQQVFREIAQHFPALTFHLDAEPNEWLDASLEFPEQQALAFPVHLNLQGDELHLNAGSAFWVEWFPCTDPEVIQRYKDAVVGLIAGEHRIREHYRAGRPVKAELQFNNGGVWETFAVWSTLHIPLPWEKTYAILQNGRDRFGKGE